MAFLQNELYDEIPKELLSTDGYRANNFLNNLIKTVIPAKDYSEPHFNKSILVLNYPQKKDKHRRKCGVVSKKEKRKLKANKCPKNGWNYSEFGPLRQLWTDYMTKNLRYCLRHQANVEIIDNILLNSILAKSDYHGAEMKIVRTKNPSLLGIQGTCIMDSKNTFKIISKDNKCRTVPKADCVFNLQINTMQLTVFGKYMTLRPAERSAKKVKRTLIPDL